jgi:hypothetical protein
MNIKITKEQFDILKQYTISRYTFGSHLHKTNTEQSDKDIVLILDDIFNSDRIYPNIHCFQFDDIENNTQWMLTTESTFYKNLLSGESNIFAELVLFTDITNSDKLLTCRTYKIIKGFVGRAKFDLKLLNTSKDKKNRKSFHISRCLYVAECLLEGRLPELNDIGRYQKLSKDELQSKELQLRTKCNSMYENNELTMYPILNVDNKFPDIHEIEELLMNANNIKEFKYD